MQFSRDRGLALVALVLGLAVALVWVPLDSASGILEQSRRRVSVGDAAAPTLAALFIIIGALLLWIERVSDEVSALTWRNAVYLLWLTGVLGLALALMWGLGPLAARLWGAGEYRLLRDTAPWSQIGFLCGGTAMVAGLVGLVDGRLSGRGLALGLVSTMVLIALYDLPFDDILLPPNGDY